MTGVVGAASPAIPGQAGDLGDLGSRLQQGMLWVPIGRALIVLLNLVGSVLLARVLAPADHGSYLILWSVLGFASLLATFGTPEVATRRLASSLATGGAAGRSVTTAVLKLTVAGTGAVAVGGLLAAHWLAPEQLQRLTTGGLVVVVVLILLGRCLQEVVAEGLRGVHDLRAAVLVGGLTYAAVFAALLAAAGITDRTMTLHRALVLTVVALAPGLVLGAVALRRNLSGAVGGPPVLTVDVLRESWPLLVNRVTLFAVSQADLWVVAMFASAETVALYGIAVRVILLVETPLVVANQIIPSTVAELASEGRWERMQRLLRTSATVTGVPAVLVGMALMVAGGSILELVFGEFYRAAWPLLAVLLVGRTINVLFGSCGVALIMARQGPCVMRISAVSGTVTVTAALAGHLLLGTIGIAVAASLGMSLQNALLWRATKARLGIRTDPDWQWLWRGVRNLAAASPATHGGQR